MAARSFSKKKIVVIVVGIIILFAALAGAYAIMARDMDKSQASQSMTPAKTNDTLMAFVNAFYKEYETQPVGGPDDNAGRTAVVKKYGTDNAVANFVAQEGMCFQNIPASVTSDDVESLESPFRVNVTYNFIETPTTAVVTLLERNGVLKIDSLSC